MITPAEAARAVGRWVRRFWRPIAFAALAVPIAYLVGANVMLRAGAVQKMFESTDSVKTDFRSAWTLWPGVVRVKDLKVIIQDSNVQASIDMKDVRVTLRLRDLLSRVFHATRVRGSGVVFRFRHRVRSEVASRPYVAALAPVEGFPSTPLYGPPGPPPDVNKLWTVHLEDVDVAVAELWIQQFRYLGPARATGAFRLRPTKHLWVGPAKLDLAPGTVLAAGRELLAGLAGTIGCQVFPFDVDKPTGMQVFQFISARARLSARLGAGSAGADLFMPTEAGIRVDQTGATLEVDAVMDRGILVPPTRVVLAGDRLDIGDRRLEANLRGPWTLTATAAQGAGGTVRLDVSRALVGRPAVDIAPAEIRFAVVRATSTSANVAIPWTLAEADVHAGSLSVPDLGLVNDPERQDRFFRAGSAEAEGALGYRQGKLKASGSAQIHGAAIETKATRIRASASVELELDDADVDGRTGRLRADVRATDVAVRHGRDWTLDAPAATADLLVDARRGLAAGPVKLVANQMRVSIGETRAAASVAARLQLAGVDIDRGAGEFSAAIALNANLVNGRDVVSGWWALLRVSPSRFDARGDVTLSSRIDARFRDGRPALLVLKGADEIPGWLPEVLPLNGLGATLQVRRACGSTDVRILHAQGGPLTASGVFHATRAATGGALVVRLRTPEAVSVGLTFRGRHVAASPLAGDRWLGEKVGRLEQGPQACR